MSDPKVLPPRSADAEPNGSECEDASEDQSSQGPSLTLLYSLIALAIAVAIFFAMMIVLPFYRRR